jgi:ubiquinone/menaquinone biosynthesis C-methylase UbiE
MTTGTMRGETDPVPGRPLGAFGPDIQRAISQSKWADAIFRLRTRDVLRKSRFSRYLPAAGRLLDLGSGLGYITETVLRESPGRSCVMMDPVNAVSPHVARRLAPFSSYAIKGSGTHLPFAHATFDGVLAAFVLHHVPLDGQELILAEIRRVLRPGGVFVLLEDTPQNAREARTTLMADRRTNFEPDEAPHHYRSPAEWRRHLPRHGLRVEHVVPFTRVFPSVTIRAVQHCAFVCGRE